MILAGDIDPQVWFAGLVGIVFAGAMFDIGIAFLMRGTDEAAGDDRY